MSDITVEQAIALLRDEDRHMASTEDAERGKWTNLEITIEEAESIAALLDTMQADSAALRQALETVRDDFHHIFDCVPVEECEKTNCGVKDAGTYCYEIARAVSAGLSTTAGASLLENHAAEVAALQKRMRAQEAELRELREAQRWIPVGERLPGGRKAVLVWCPERKNTYTAHLNPDSSWCVHGGYLIREQVTHWMPLPTAPEGGCE